MRIRHDVGLLVIQLVMITICCIPLGGVALDAGLRVDGLVV